MPPFDGRLLICDCEGTMPLDGGALAKACGQLVSVNTQLCRSQTHIFEAAAKVGGGLMVCCTQEAPLFAELLADGDTDAEPSFVNIRERAGWSEDAAAATPKIAALLAEAAVAVPGTRALTVTSQGRALVYGAGAVTLAAADRLADRLDVTVVLSDAEGALPPARTTFPIACGTIGKLDGHLGAFDVVVDGYAPARPASRAGLEFEPGRDGVTLTVDMIVDLSGATPPIQAPEKRDGYLRAAPRDAVAVERVLFAAADMVGEFEKPIYVDYDPALCAHSRSAVIGCTRCLDGCPASAIAPDGDLVRIDHDICGGCGTCASVCPTGAASYAMPARDALFNRLRALLGSYHEVGGGDAVLLVHDTRHGDEMIAMMARLGRGLPARVLPFAVNEVTQIGFDVLISALAYGAGRVVLLVPATRRDELDGLAEQVALAEAALNGLGHGAGRVALVDDADPDALADRLYALEAPPAFPPADHLAMGGKRTLATMALEHLHRHAPTPAEVLALPAGAPFGGVRVEAAGCTLCLACVGACPTGALMDNPDAPMLRFSEQACIQCGLCRNTCPESVITLVPRFNFTAEARREVTLKEEEPFACVVCGKGFAPRSSIEKMLDKLAGHAMFADDPSALERLKMCEDCRVTAHFAADQPMTHGTVRRTRTTDDYLEGREDGED